MDKPSTKRNISFARWLFLLEASLEERNEHRRDVCPTQKGPHALKQQWMTHLRTRWSPRSGRCYMSGLGGTADSTKCPHCTAHRTFCVHPSFPAHKFHNSHNRCFCCISFDNTSARLCPRGSWHRYLLQSSPSRVCKGARNGVGRVRMAHLVDTSRTSGNYGTCPPHRQPRHDDNGHGTHIHNNGQCTLCHPASANLPGSGVRLGRYSRHRCYTTHSNLHLCTGCSDLFDHTGCRPSRQHGRRHCNGSCSTCKWKYTHVRHILALPMMCNESRPCTQHRYQ